MRKICVLCGDEFEATSAAAKICKKDHYATCQVCGQQFIWNHTYAPTTCSARCRKFKRKQTNLERYGAEFPLQNPGIAEKMKATRIKCNSGSYNGGAIREKTKETNLSKYGVPTVLLLPEVQERSKQTRMSSTSIQDKVAILKPLVPTSIESQHKNAVSRIKRLLDLKNIEYESNYRIDDTYYDIFVPTMDVCLEINDTGSCNILTNGITDKYVHLNKSKIAESQGLRCVHVFDWDNYELIAKMLMPKKRIGARNCKLFKLKTNYTEKFLEMNHLQGSVRKQLLCLGLVHEDKLIQVMTFGKSRYSSKYTMEMLRLCTDPGYIVYGGSERLFKFATDYFYVENFIAYCDLSKFQGGVYRRLGMEPENVNPPQVNWSSGSKRITARLLAQHGAARLLKIDNNNHENNDELLVKNGWLPVYDCGHSSYAFR